MLYLSLVCSLHSSVLFQVITFHFPFLESINKFSSNSDVFFFTFFLNLTILSVRHSKRLPGRGDRLNINVNVKLSY